MNLPGGFEWIIILVIVILIFGVGRISKIAGELGKGIRSFRDGISGKDEKDKGDTENAKTDAPSEEEK